MTPPSTPSPNADTAVASQAGRLLAIDTPLGPDVLLLTELNGTEALSRSFLYTIKMVTLTDDAEVVRLLGRPVTLWLRNDSETERRPLHGHIRHLTRLSVDARGYKCWEAEVVPWMWFLTRSVDCRIYQNLSVPDILRSVFDEQRLARYEMRLLGEYPKVEFCVQYRESTFAFVSRLMEQLGIFFFFEHAANHHLLVLADSNTVMRFTAPRELRVVNHGDVGQIQSLRHDYDFRSGAWALSDYDFESPTTDLRVARQTNIDNELMRQFEHYDYPGSYTVRDRGDGTTRLRIEAEEACYHIMSGTGSSTVFEPGKRFTPLLPGEAEQPAYLLTEVRHSARSETFSSDAAEPPHYRNEFSAIPSDTPYRPERTTPKSVVLGPQTATVVGPAGETIHTDQYGRVRLLFHWDRRGKRDDTASCWVRVSQNAAGSFWGGVSIPHVGQEVIVAFRNGDPDRPIVIGRVHNGTNKPPLNLPRDKDKTILRDHGDNKIIMHGKAGKEHVTFVSPRAVNLIAARRPAKPLSSAITFTNEIEGASPFEDATGLNALQATFKASTTGTVDPETNKKTWNDPNKPNTIGDPGDDGPLSYSDTVTSVDLNSIAENNVNSLSGGNTSTWVGGNSNTWVKGDLHQEVIGDTTTKSHGSVTNTYKASVRDTIDVAHEEETTVHNEFTGVHNEITGIHTEITSAHIENTIGLHTEFHLGPHIDINDAMKSEFTPLLDERADTKTSHLVIDYSLCLGKIMCGSSLFQSFDITIIV